MQSAKSGSIPKGKDSIGSSSLNQHILKDAKRLTESEKSKFQDKMTLREIEDQSVHKNFRDNNTGYVHDRLFEEWSIYFDFTDFKKFKKEFPEFLDWLDSPEDHINELLKADAESN